MELSYLKQPIKSIIKAIHDEKQENALDTDRAVLNFERTETNSHGPPLNRVRSLSEEGNTL
jgi:hypothetical protein